MVRLIGYFENEVCAGLAQASFSKYPLITYSIYTNQSDESVIIYAMFHKIRRNRLIKEKNWKKIDWMKTTKVKISHESFL